MTDWLTDWLIDRLTDWLIDGLIDWLVDWLIQGLEDVVKDRQFSATKSTHLTADGEEDNDGELPRKKSKESW